MHNPDFSRKDPNQHGEGGQPPEMPPPPARNPGQPVFSRVVKKMDGFCLRTILDLDECRKVAQESTAKKDAEIKERLQSAEPAAPKQLLTDYRTATGCPANWQDMRGTGIYKICHQCRLHVYDFSDTDIADALNLVSRREGKENPCFYRRSDGKFLTSDCPVGLQKQRQKIIGGIVAATVVIVAVAAVFLAPKAPKQAAVSQPPAEQQRSKVESHNIDFKPSNRPQRRTGGAFGVGDSVPIQTYGTPQPGSGSLTSSPEQNMPAALEQAGQVMPGAGNSTMAPSQLTGMDTPPAALAVPPAGSNSIMSSTPGSATARSSSGATAPPAASSSSSTQSAAPANSPPIPDQAPAAPNGMSAPSSQQPSNPYVRYY